jgi:DNA repair protein RadA/Sms
MVQNETCMPLLVCDTADDQQRITTCLSELDRVLGGGMLPGMVILIGGDPGIGKSTLLLQCANLGHLTLYVTGEESAQQVAMRAKRLNVTTQHILLLTTIDVANILTQLRQHQPTMVIIDSIQTLHDTQLGGLPGSVGQVRECAAQLIRYAKTTQTILWLIGHVTKEGALAGPRVLEHMVDTVIYFEASKDSRFRALRAIKHRFGPVNELGLFAMTHDGLKSVTNPSGCLLSRAEQVPGSVVCAVLEGSRPLLVEVQALADDSKLAMPRRVGIGIESDRMALLLALISRYAGVRLHQHDVFLNVVGGLTVRDTAIDLACVMACLSSVQKRTIPHTVCCFGEIGLSGEIRPIPQGMLRVQEAVRQGFTTLIVPKANRCYDASCTVYEVATVQDVMTWFHLYSS